MNASDEDPRAKVKEEFRLLLDAVADKAEPWLQRLRDSEEHVPGTCDWCPVCAVAAVLRGEHSELAAKAAEHAVGLLAVLRAAVRQPAAPQPAAQPQPAGQPPRVQKIVVQRGTDEEPRC
jgi:phytoene/squalene synthetase